MMIRYCTSQIKLNMRSNGLKRQPTLYQAHWKIVLNNYANDVGSKGSGLSLCVCVCVCVRAHVRVCVRGGGGGQILL